MKDPNYTDAKVQWENSILIMREIGKIQFLENFEAMAPYIATELKKHGVTFPDGGKA